MDRLLGRRTLFTAAACAMTSACVEPPEEPTPTRSPLTEPSTTATASPASDPRELAVEAVLADWDARTRVGQLFVVGVPSTDLPSGSTLLARWPLGGLFIAGRTDMPSASIGAAVGRWQAGNPRVPLWVATDQEGGSIRILRGEGFSVIPSALEQADLRAADLTHRAAAWGAELRAAGVNLDLAPVADLVDPVTAAENPPIGALDRQYGATTSAVVAKAGAFLSGLGAAQVTGVLKHFPGLGQVSANTDYASPVVDDVTAADSPSVAAFAELSRRPERPLVMVSSATYARIDGSTPAVFSAAVVSGLLREELGFTGPVISDDLAQAEAVADVDPGDRAVRFLQAGGTLVLVVRSQHLDTMVRAVLDRVASDPQFAALIDDAVRTALRGKFDAGLLNA